MTFVELNRGSNGEDVSVRLNIESLNIFFCRVVSAGLVGIDQQALPWKQSRALI